MCVRAREVCVCERVRCVSVCVTSQAVVAPGSVV